MIEPGPDNEYLAEHADLLLSSYRQMTGKNLLKPVSTGQDFARMLYQATFGVVSHDTSADPVFNYANLTALRLFELDWRSFTSLPSRKSAEPVNRAERERLLARVTRDGFIDDYSGIRISASGRRFRIEEATVWHLIDEKGYYCGQAAVFAHWTEL